MVANGCQGLQRIFYRIVDINEFYSQYPVFDGIEGIFWYSKFDLGVSIWLCEGIAIPLNTVKYRQILIYGNYSLKLIRYNYWRKFGKMAGEYQAKSYMYSFCRFIMRNWFEQLATKL